MSADDVIIVGAGLAGAAAAAALSPHYRIRVLEAETPAAGASGAAAGLVNPFMGRRARPVWRLHEALDALVHLLDAADASSVFPQQGVLRPVVEAEQAAPFRTAAKEHPSLAAWLPAATVRNRFPDVETDVGALYVDRGGAIDVSAMVEALLSAARARGAVVETDAPVVYWRETPSDAAVEVARGPETEDLHADRVLLALGQGYPRFPELRRLDLEGVKGQTVRVARPPAVRGPLLPLSGRGYVVPDGDHLILGSNYDNNFDDLRPDPDATAYIREKTARMVPGLETAPVADVQAGVRVKHRPTNRPIVGPLPDRTRIWTLTALGSKGLLTAPLLARALPDYFHDPTTIPDDVRTPT